VKNIEYATAQADNTLIQHIAEIDYRITYYSDRFMAEEGTPVESINNDVDVE